MKNKNVFNTILFTTLLIVITAIMIVVFSFFKVNENETYLNFISLMTAIGVFFSFLVLAIEFIALIFNKEASIYTFLTSLFLFVMLLTSRDMSPIYSRLGVNVDYSNKYVAMIFLFLNYTASFAAIFSIFTFFYTTYKLSVQKGIVVLTVTFYGIGAVSLIALKLITNNIVNSIYIIPFLLFAGLGLFFITPQMFALNKTDYTYAFVMLILFGVVICFITEALGAHPDKGINSIGIVTFLIVIIDILFFTIYLMFVAKTTKAAYQKEKIEQRNKELSVSVLKNQMDPHFIFNSLNTVKSLYAIDNKKGDIGIDLLSKNIRAITKAKDNDLIPLSQELDNVNAFIEFENLKLDEPFTVYFNIDTDDFMVPILSIQTLVENATKYSRVNDKEDGYIEIATSEDDNNYYLIVRDNGVGFDVEVVKKDSYGINNAKERFVILLNAKFEISSKINEGTTISITIPKKKEQGEKAA